MKRMLAVLAAAVTAVVAQTVMATETNLWKGASGDVDWNDAGSWSLGVPTADQVVSFVIGRSDESQNGVYNVTPPESYAGKVIVLNPTAETSFSTYVKFNVGEGATWTVAGDGIIIATDGVSARISGEFAGSVSVLAGVAFTPSAAMSEAVSFIGNGRLDLSAAGADKFMDSFSGFHGTVALPDGMVVPDVSMVQNAELELKDDVALSIPEHTLAYGGTVAIPDWTTTAAWSFNGTTYETSSFPQHPFNADPPAVAADGSLTLTDDPGQAHSVFYKGHAFSCTEDWGVEFTYEPSLPKEKDYFGEGTDKTHQFGGWFGFVLQSIGPGAVATQMSDSMPGYTGVTIFHYQGNVQVLSEGRYDTHSRIRASTNMDGINLSKPMQMKVSCVGRVLTMTIIQDGKSFSFRKSLATILTGAYYIGFQGETDSSGSGTTSGNIYWVRETVRDFRGWYRSRAAGGWRDVATESDYSAFDEGSWFLRQITSDNGSMVTNEGNASVSADGSFVLCAATANGKKYSGRAISKKTLSRNSRYLLSFDLDFGGSGTSQGNGWTFGFSKQPYSNNTFNKYDGSSEFSAAVDTGWSFGAYWQHKPFNKYIVSYCLASREFKLKTLTSPADFVVGNNQKGHYDAFYDPIDGLQGLDVAITVPSPTATKSGRSGRFDYVWTAEQLEEYRKTTPDALYVHFRGAASDTKYQELNLRNVRVKELTDNSGARIARVSVAEDAAATLSAGPTVVGSTTPVARIAEVSLAKGATMNLAFETSPALSSNPSGTVAVEALSAGNGCVLAAGTGVTVVAPTSITCFGDPAAAMSISGNVKFGDTLRIAVPRSWKKSNQKINLVDLTSATVVGTIPAVTVVDENGQTFGSQYAVTADAQGVSIDFQRGMILMVR